MKNSTSRFAFALAFAFVVCNQSYGQDYSVTTTQLGFTSINPALGGAGTEITGTQFGSSDDGEFNLTLPFTFSYFGQTFMGGSAIARIGVNGAILLSQTSVTTEISFTNTDLSSASAFNNGIYVAWEDLAIGTSSMAPMAGKIFQQTMGTSPTQVLIIEYSMCSQSRFPVGASSPTTLVDAQIAIFESGRIEFRYSPMNNFGTAGVTTGIKGPSPTNLIRGFPSTNNGQATPAANVIFTPSIGDPDISLSNLIVTTPTTPGQALIGDLIGVSVDVSNLATTANSMNFPVNVYLSLDSTIDVNDQLIGSFTGGTQVNAGGTTSLSQNFTIPTPNPAASGRNYFIGVIADPANTQMDPSLSNNTVNTGILIGLPFYTVSNQTRGTFTSIVGMAGTNTIMDSAGASFDEELVFRPGGAPFDFRFFGVNVLAGASVGFDSNANVSFNGGAIDPEFINESVPGILAPNNFIALFWDDLIGRPASGALVSDRVDGTAPNRVWTIEYTNMENFSTSILGRFSGQIVITETTNTILLRYNEITPFTSASATIGLENVFGTDGVDGTGLGASNSTLPADDLLFTPTAAMAPSFIDLVANSISAAQTLTTITGGLDVTRSISNLGTTATGSFEVSYFLVTSIDDFLIGTETVNSIMPGQTLTLTSRFTIPSNIPADTYFVGMIVNDGTPPLVEPLMANNAVLSSGTTRIVVGSGLIGDLNNDGLLDIGDIMSCVDAILNRPNDLNADFNTDGNVDVLDLQITINRVLGVP